MRDKYLEVKKYWNGDYHITPHFGWSIIIKSSYTYTKSKRKLKKYINYWKKRGYTNIRYVEVVE